MKPKIAVHSFTSCSGCQLQIIHQEGILLEMLSKVEIVSFPMVKQHNDEDAEVDIAIIEGGISRKDHVEAVKKIREKSKIVIAIGSCAVTGGIPAMRNFGNNKQIQKIVYKTQPEYDVLETADPVDKHIKVDYYVKGCPIVQEEFTAVLKELLLGKKPHLKDYPVCTECRLNETYCLLHKGQFCLGPLTYCGCDALCTRFNQPCEGCRGMLPEASVKAHVELLKNMGIKKEKLDKLFEKFYGQNPLKKK